MKDQEYDYFYDDEQDAKYCYPGTNVLKNKPRTVDISKGTVFCLVQFIESQFDDLYRELKKENFLADITDKEDMSKRLAYYLGEINMIHPFREGNGRTQRICIEQLCLNNGRFEIDFTDVTKDEMIAASVRSANVSNDMLEKLISSCLVEYKK